MVDIQVATCPPFRRLAAPPTGRLWEMVREALPLDSQALLSRVAIARHPSLPSPGKAMGYRLLAIEPVLLLGKITGGLMKSFILY